MSNKKKELEQLKVCLRESLPRLQGLWGKDFASLKPDELIGLLDQDIYIGSIKALLRTELSPVIIDNTQSMKKRGRPAGGRVHQAALKMLLLAPRKLLLEKEKTWRTQEYLADVRDRVAVNAVRKAKKKAVQDADMCIARANDLVDDFFLRHPELSKQFHVLQETAEEELKKYETSKS